MGKKENSMTTPLDKLSAEWREDTVIQNCSGTQLAIDNPNDRHSCADQLDAEIAAHNDKLAELEYRHECLKIMWEDEVNTIPPHTVDDDIDTFIQLEESHP